MVPLGAYEAGVGTTRFNCGQHPVVAGVSQRDGVLEPGWSPNQRGPRSCSR